RGARAPGRRDARLDRARGDAQPDGRAPPLQEGGVLPGVRGWATDPACDAEGHARRPRGQGGGLPRGGPRPRGDPREDRPAPVHRSRQGRTRRAHERGAARHRERPLTGATPANPPTWPAPSLPGAGAGLAVLVNANAKRGGRRVAVQIARVLPGASVRLTKSPQEILAWLRVLSPLRAVLAAGGDGSAVALVNAPARPPTE